MKRIILLVTALLTVQFVTTETQAQRRGGGKGQAGQPGGEEMQRGGRGGRGGGGGRGMGMRGGAAGGSSLFTVLDENQDGKISGTELDRAISRLDKNSDGFLTPDEAGSSASGPRGSASRRPTAGAPQPPSAARPDVSKFVDAYLTYDLNMDELLTYDELPADERNLIARGDANRDGKLNRNELAALALRQPGAPTAAPSSGFGRGRGGRGGASTKGASPAGGGRGKAKGKGRRPQ